MVIGWRTHSSLVGNWRHQHVNAIELEAFGFEKLAQMILNLLRHVTALPIPLQLAPLLCVIGPLRHSHCGLDDGDLGALVEEIGREGEECMRANLLTSREEATAVALGL